MKILSWNCRGLRETSTVQALKGLIQKHSPNGVYLCETKASFLKLERIKNRLGYDRMEIVEPEGWKGGTAFLWNENLGWDIFYKSKWIMGISINNVDGESWNLWACYCLAEREKRGEFWHSLCSLINNGSNKWACIGDFNEVCDQYEKMGGRVVNSTHNFFLKNFLDKVNKLDIGFNGNTFTWCNRRRGLANIRERLDKV